MTGVRTEAGHAGRFARPDSPGATLIVGFDDSPGSHAALEWASRLVGLDGRVVVTAVAPPATGEGQRIGGALRALTTEPSLVRCAWVPESRQGLSAADVLLRAAHEHAAGAIVVGAHGHDESQAFLGSVAHRLLRISDIPVVVVPARKGRDAP